MNFKSLVAQLANRINQPHVIEIYMRKVFASGVEWHAKQSIEVLSSVLENWVHGGDSTREMLRAAEHLKMKLEKYTERH